MSGAQISSQNIAACENCGNPIIKGQRIRSFGSGYAHVGCKPRPRILPELVRPATQSVSFAASADSESFCSSGQSPDMVDLVVQRIRSEMAQYVSRASVEVLRKIEDRVGDAISAESEGAVLKIVSQVEKSAFSKINSIVENLSAAMSLVIHDTRKKVDLEIAKTIKKVIEVRVGEASVLMGDDQVFHSCFQEVLELAAAGMNIFLPGPTGCGKTHLAEQVAKAMGLPFAMISGSAGTTESEILGTSIPNISTGENVYLESDFIRVYEGGGIFLIDEADAMDPNCLLKINAAISNGKCVVPKRYQ